MSILNLKYFRLVVLQLPKEGKKKLYCFNTNMLLLTVQESSANTCVMKNQRISNIVIEEEIEELQRKR
jgi:hypothetical protein